MLPSGGSKLKAMFAAKPKILVWDIDGVLIWHHPNDPTKDWRRTMIRENLLEPWEWFQRSDAYRACLRDDRLDPRAALEKFLGRDSASAARMIDIWLTGNRVPATKGIQHLKMLRDMGYECAIASNQDGLRAQWIDQWLESQGLGDIPAFVSCRIGAAKPEPRFFELVQNALRQRPGDLLLFDDLPVNLEAAQGCGWNVFQVRLETPEAWPEIPDLDVS